MSNPKVQTCTGPANISDSHLESCLTDVHYFFLSRRSVRDTDPFFSPFDSCLFSSFCLFLLVGGFSRLDVGLALRPFTIVQEVAKVPTYV